MRVIALTWAHILIDNRLAALHNQWLKLLPPKLSYEKPGILNVRSPGGFRFATSLMNNPGLDAPPIVACAASHHAAHD